MAYAWADGYYIDYSLSGTPRLTFMIPVSGTGTTYWPWLNLTGGVKYDVLEKQLSMGNVFIRWNDSTNEIYRVTARSTY